MVNTNGVTGLEPDAGDEPGGSGLAPSAMRGRGRWGRREMAAPAGRLRLRPRPQGLCGRPCKGTPPPQKGTVRAASPGHPLGNQRRAFARCRPPKRVKAPPVSRPPQARGGRCRLWAAGGRAAPPGPRRGPARCGAVLLREAFLRSSA